MAQAAALLSPTFEAVNDNIGPGPGQDPWRWLIERLKSVDTGFAIYAAQERLKGTPVRVFAHMVIEAFEQLERSEAAYQALCDKEAI